MCCPRLNELPSPPAEKTGWPWTEESQQLPNKMADGSEWPKISIVTPSYNQGEFIEETIRSVLLQGYPNLEYIVIDGESIDNSVEIINKYSPWIAHWVSEQDRGQSDAINKGFAVSSGQICAYLNSDDLFLPEAFKCFAQARKKHPSSQWFTSTVLHGESFNNYRVWKPGIVSLSRFVTNQTIAQQGVFWDKAIRLQPWFDLEKSFNLDHKFFIENYLAIGPPKAIPNITAFFREQQNSKTCIMKSGKTLNSEYFELAEEIKQRVDPQLANAIEKEKKRKEISKRMRKILSQKKIKNRDKILDLFEGLELFRKAPLRLRDRIFISGNLRLLFRVFGIDK